MYRGKIMSTLRGWIYYIVLALTLIPLAIALIILYPASLSLRYRLATGWARFMLKVGEVICGMRYQFKGLENFPTDDSPLLILSKHQSAWDIFALGAIIPHQTSFVYKKELHYVPVFGQALATLHMMAIDRKKGSRAYEQFMHQGQQFLQKGWWLAMFPEGTRTAPGQKTHYKSGGARFAVATGTPIIPIALNSGECWPRNSISKTPGLITVCIGPKIETKNRTFEDVQQQLVGWIEGQMHEISPEAYSGRITNEFEASPKEKGSH